MERRAHPRYQCPDVIAMAREPAATLDYYFKVANVSLGGLALVTSDPKAFPFEVDSVLDIQLFLPSGLLACRGVVARIITDEPGAPRGFGVRLFSFASGDRERWLQLVEENSKRGLP
ncbi:MAG: PilZ domain-containing protein [Deltaproteobacteria bacterium]|nr:PilZ domain-containing protein [Deltaproteobacteria bacterium]